MSDTGRSPARFYRKTQALAQAGERIHGEVPPATGKDNIFVKQHRTSQPRDVCLLCDRLGPSLCEVEDHPGRHVTMLQPVQDFINRRQGLQLDVSFHLAFCGEAQRFGHIVTRSDE